MAPQGQCILDYGPQSGTPSLGLQCPGGKRPWEGHAKLGRMKELGGKTGVLVGLDLPLAGRGTEERQEENMLCLSALVL